MPSSAYQAAKRAKAVGAVSQATGQLHGALQGVDAVETMVADVQGGTAVLAGVALDIKHQATENRILGPGGTPGSLSLLGHTLFLSAYLVSRSFWPSSLPLFANP